MQISSKTANFNLNNISDSPFQPRSSEIDWCEPNYVVSEYIAEFWNTVSNIFFFLVPPIMIILFTSYSKRAANGVTILWILLIVIGIGSTYFHATLSLAGQLADEICILWIIMAGYTLFLPYAYTPQSLRVQRVFYTLGVNNTPLRYRFICICIALTIMITGLSIIYPYASSFALMILGLPAFVFIALHVAKCDNHYVRRRGIHFLSTWIIAVTIWICDRIFCSFWISISFPYLHAIWHVLIPFCGNEAIVICAYLVIKYQYPQANLVLNQWPNEKWGWFTLVYLKFHDDVK